MSRAPLPPAQYYASLPKQIAGAGAILHDGLERILLVRPSYRQDTWEIPGGGMEAGEYPWQTARREVKEELGLDLAPGRLLVVDWVPRAAMAGPRWPTSCSRAGSSPRPRPSSTCGSTRKNSAGGA